MRLGLLSTARINGRILDCAPEGVEIAAVGSRDGARAHAYADEHGIARSYGSYEALLADPELDAVYVSLPNGPHHEWTMKALAAGKHVLVEKPYSRRPDDVEEAWDLAARQGLVVAEAFMWRHHPQAWRAQELVEEGAIGRLRLIRASFSFPLFDLSSHRMQLDLDGGALMDLGCYCISGARLLGGEPQSVLGEQVTGPTGVDVDFYATLRFPRAVVAQIDASYTLPLRQRLEAVGEEGALVLEAPWVFDWGGGMHLQRGDAVEQVTVASADSYRLELEDFAAAVRGERPPLLGREDALQQARVLDALYRSAASGAAVKL
ncbi:MAG: Gfo/Idh/MocA family oxidoreductase [Actinomycetota bacterium]|nr:Gfo/Idh/MocA family oxidoreductase [Actinomycetota bacterium]